MWLNMDTLVIFGLINAFVASLLAIGAIFATWICRNPYAARVIWLVILLRFIVPPILTIQMPWIPNAVTQQLNSTELASSSQHKCIDPSLPVTESKEFPSSHVEIIGKITVAPPLAESGLSRFMQSYSLPSVVGVVWLFGTFLIAIFVVHRIRKFHYLLLRDTRIAPEPLRQRVNQVATQIGVSKEFHVRLTGGRIPPLVWCVGKQTTIVLPSALVEHLDASKMTSILAHEIMHVHRNDSRARWLEILVVSLFWWCPLSWIARRMVQEAEERCCDADVLHCFPKLRKSYANALLETLDFLASTNHLNFAGTGFTRSSSMKRRFKMIINSRTQSRPATTTQWLMSVAAIALIATTPVISFAAKPIVQSTQAGASTERCKIKLEDGTLIEGQMISIGNERIIVARGTQNATEEIQSAKKEKSTLWDFSLGECFRIALTNNPKTKFESNPNGLLLLSPHSNNQLSAQDFREAAENSIRDVEHAYWNAWLAHRNLEAVRAGRDRALETWKTIHAFLRVGDSRGEVDTEAQSRAHYFLFSTQVENRIAEVERTESLLRYILSLNLEDGRTIRLTEAPQDSHHRFDFKAVTGEALANRVELARQRKQIQRRKTQLEASQKNLVENPVEKHAENFFQDFSLNIGDRRALANVRHNELLLARDLVILNGMKLEISHQLGAAVRDVDLTYDLAQTNQNRSMAAHDERKAVESVFQSGRVTLDLLLDSQRREVEAEEAYSQTRVDYAKSLSRVHLRKGTLLTWHGIVVEEP